MKHFWIKVLLKASVMKFAPVPPAIPVSRWSIAIAGLLMGLTIIVIRKRIKL